MLRGSLRQCDKLMEPAVASAYLWLKAVHVIAVIAWMAGLFYLPRLFVYHAGLAEKYEPGVFKTMESRLYRIIMWPAMIVTWLSGAILAWMIFRGGSGMAPWAWVKLGAVLAMTALHLRLGWHLSAFQRDINRHGSRYFRILNEVPTMLLVVIVIMVIVKPF
jgi:protoporphyrinogen IX oxidase